MELKRHPRLEKALLDAANAASASGSLADLRRMLRIRHRMKSRGYYRAPSHPVLDAKDEEFEKAAMEMMQELFGHFMEESAKCN